MTPDPRLLGGLDILSAIVQTGSFVRAGERVGLTQSGVSRAVARLEQRVGVRLLDRNARAVTLTDEGKQFPAQVAPLLVALEAAVDSAAGSAGRVRGRLRGNVDPFFARYVLAPRLATFMAAYPELELELVVSDHAGNLVADGFDAAVRFGEPEPSSLISRRLLQTRIVTCASPAYLARRGKPRHPWELEHGHEAILFVDPRTGRPFEWEFHQARKRVRVEVKGRLLVNDVATAVGACLAGQGVAQLMELGTTELIAAGTLVNMFPRWRDELFPLYVLYPSRHLPSARVRTLVDFVIASTAAVAR